MSHRAQTHAVLLVALALGCQRATTSTRSDAAATAPVGATAISLAGGAAAAALLAAVVDPWTWPRAAGATDRDRAIEDIGPYEPVDRRTPGAPLVNTNGHYWTALVGLAWDRDVDLRFDGEPVDLDADGIADTRLTRTVRVTGGILARPELFGLVRTPEDPRGRVGRISVSTGVLGLREALTPDGRPSGHIGMTCFLCHGGTDVAGAGGPDTKGAARLSAVGHGPTVLGLPGATFDYGLLLATAAVLADDNRQAAAHRRAHGFPDGRTVRARLLLAGPGRQDLTGEFGLDVTVPDTHAAHYAGTARVRQGTSGIVNPISVPGILAAPGMDLQNWSGSEVASARWLRRVVELGGRGQPAWQTLAALGLPPANPDDPRGSAAARRALLLDLRNLGTLGLQQDSFPGLLWADAVYGHAAAAEGVNPAALATIPRMYGTAALRRVLATEKMTPPPPASEDVVRRGREIFANRVVGVIANRQIFKESPARYAAAKPGGTARLPLLAPIDETLPATFPVRCADCHSATPGGEPINLGGAAAPPLGRCSHCHRSHAELEPASPGAAATGAAAEGRRRVTVDALLARRSDSAAVGATASAPEPAAEVSFCSGCHQRHRPFAPVVYSSSLLLPFDADGDGKSQDDEGDDGSAAGIGTEALLAFDVPRPQRPAAGFALDLPFLQALHTVRPVTTARVGAGWVRVPPLLGVRATAPYLHNGSVPTLEALLQPAARRPVTFPLGSAGFVFDTRLPGNRNLGHEFGTRLSPREKADLVAFLRSL